MSYLDNLKFNKRLKNTFVYKYLTNVRLVMLIILSVLVFGIFSFLTLPRRLNPEIKLPIVSVRTTLPGASSLEVEQLVTVKIEDAVDSADGVTKVTSTSSDSVSVVTIEFESGIDPKSARDDIQAQVDTITDFPDDITTPLVNDFDFEDIPVWTFILTSRGSTSDLITFANTLEEELESLTAVDRVEVVGNEETEVQINIDPEKISDYGLNIFDISTKVGAYLESYPSGSVNTSTNTFLVTIQKSVTSVNDIRDILITNGSSQVKLGDIADIQEKSRSNQPVTLYADTSLDRNLRAVTFYVYKDSNVDFTSASTIIEGYVFERISENEIFEIQSVEDVAAEINDQFNSLFKNFLSTISLVFITLLLFLGIRQALVASFSIPVAFLISFIVMNVTGQTLNFLSTFSLLLALGLLVDDAIVIISGVTSYFKTGKFTADEAGMLTWKDFIVPIWITTLTTVWAFFPLLLATGIIGEFIRPIPIIVSSTLIASTAVAVLINLPLMILLLNPNVPKRVKVLVKFLVSLLLVGLVFYVLPKNILTLPIVLVFILFLFFAGLLLKSYKNNKYVRGLGKNKTLSKLKHYMVSGVVDTSKLRVSYTKFISKTLQKKSRRNQVLIGVIIFSVFSYMLVPLGFVVNEFFPKTDNDLIYVSVRLPSGTNLQQTTAEADRLLSELKNTQGAKFVVSEVGRSFNAETGSSSEESNSILFTLVLLPKNERESSIVIANSIRNSYVNYNKGELLVQEISGGPPAGGDVVVKLFGDDLSVLANYANQLSAKLSQTSGVVNVDTSIKQTTSKITFVPDNNALLSEGLTIDTVGVWARSYLSDFKIDEVTLGDTDEKNLVIKINGDNKNPSELSELYIPSQNGPVSFSKLGEFILSPNTTSITREDGKRVVTVSASVLDGFSISQINGEVEDYMQAFPFESGDFYSTGGVNEENNRSVQSIFRAMLLSLILILITLVVQLKSFRKSLIVVLVIPLAVSGVFVVFALTKTPLSFPALIGVLALFGIVINNSIVVVDKINLNLSTKMPFKDSVVDAASYRLEPIMFSSLTTIMGLIPITVSDPLWRGLGGAIISGLLVSGAIMLLFIPVVYYNVYKGDYQKSGR
jgi:HAE1 family hydrophobic/amphiphilic exporter-1